MLEHGHGCYYSGLPAGRECVEFHVRGDEGGSEFSVGSGTSTTASDVVSDIVDLVELSDVMCSQYMSSEHTFSQFLSATIGPSVARVSAPKIIPSLKRHPTMVVPVLVALGRGIPRSVRKVFLIASRMS